MSEVLETTEVVKEKKLTGKVEVRPLPLEKFHGKKGKESFTRPKAVEVLYSSEVGGYDTGLTEEEAEEYSKKMGVKLDSMFNPDAPHPYWGSKAATIYLKNETMYFDPALPADFVKIKNMKAQGCKFVANSLSEWENGLWPEATHVIFDEEEEVSVQATKVQIKNKAIIMASKMDADGKASMVQILSKRTVRGRSANFIDVEIDKIIEADPAEFVRLASMGREEVTNRAMILEAVYKGILTREGSKILFMGEIIGMDVEDALKYYNDPNNQRIKAVILEQLNGKR